VELGLRLDGRDWSLSCSALKHQLMTHAVLKFQEALRRNDYLNADEIETFVGRALHLCQIWPAVFAFLRGGYALTNVRATARPGCPFRRRVRRVRLRPDGMRALEFSELLAVITTHLEANASVALAGAAAVDTSSSAARLISVTDVSGVDGVGGFVFSPSTPGVVTIVSEAWPPDIQIALDEAAKPRAERAIDAPSLSLPAGELFGMWAVPLAAAELHGEPEILRSITAVGDCDPAARCIARGAGRTRVMGGLVQLLNQTTGDCLPVAIPRRLNFDADRLSHPNLLLDVLASIPRQLSPRIAPIPERAWDALRDLVYKTH
jgi:hypothetical protein